MNRNLKLVLATGGLAAVSAGANAQVAYFDNYGAFSAAALAAGCVPKGFEDFEDYQAGTPDILGFDGPLGAAGAGPYDPGAIEPNLVIDREFRGGTVPGLVFVNSGAGFGNTSAVVAANYFVDALDVSFLNGKCAVWLTGGSLLGGPSLLIEVFDTSNTLMGGFLVGGGAAGTQHGFIGTNIGRINVFDPGDGAEYVDDIEMWNANPVPEPFTMILGAAGLTAAAIRRRRKA